MYLRETGGVCVCVCVCVCGVDSVGSGQGAVAGSCKNDDGPLCSGTTELSQLLAYCILKHLLYIPVILVV
jgi:hypothetical protein